MPPLSVSCGANAAICVPAALEAVIVSRPPALMVTVGEADKLYPSGETLAASRVPPLLIVTGVLALNTLELLAL